MLFITYYIKILDIYKIFIGFEYPYKYLLSIILYYLIKNNKIVYISSKFQVKFDNIYIYLLFIE